MRKLCLAVVASSIVYAQSPEAVAARELQEAQKPVETWMGSRLVIQEDAPSQLPAGESARPAPVPKEAQIRTGSIMVTMSQMRAFQSSQKLAEFLAHAAAHVRLGHPERLDTLSKARGILAPDQRAAGVLAAETRAQMEKEAEPVAAEFMETAGCARGSCAMFGLLLRAARRP
jgi:hypothetical protein